MSQRTVIEELLAMQAEPSVKERIIRPHQQGVLVQSPQQIIHAIKSGKKIITVEESDMYCPTELTIPKGVTVTFLGGQMLFGPEGGIVNKGTLLDDKNQMIFAPKQKNWYNIYVNGGNVCFEHAHIYGGHARPFERPWMDEETKPSHETGGGGNLFVMNGLLHLGKNTLVENGKAMTGGGIYVGEAEADLLGRVRNNSAATVGGAICVYRSTVYCDAQIRGNNADMGGGISCLNSNIVIYGTCSKNKAKKNGGFLFSTDSTTQVNAHTNFNNAGANGGAIYSDNSTLSLDGCINYSESSQCGGGVYAKNSKISGKINVAGCKSNVGGGMCLEKCTTKLSSNLARNHARYNGGAIAVLGGGLTFDGRCSMNKAKKYGVIKGKGGAIAYKEADVKTENAWFNDNEPNNLEKFV